MRLNRYIAMYSHLSRRKADDLIEQGKVVVNRHKAHLGSTVQDGDVVVVDGVKLEPIQQKNRTVLLHKPVGYVCSRDGQGSPSVYTLLPGGMKSFNIAGRLDKDSSGLIVLTNDGQFIQTLTHPSYNKEKVYIITLEATLSDSDIETLRTGVDIGDDTPSSMDIKRLPHKKYQVTLTEGRNRQIRRSLKAVGHNVVTLHRIKLGPYKLSGINEEQFIEL